MEPKYKTVQDIKEPPLIGRDKSLQEMINGLRRAEKGNPCFLLVQGETGSGKTRMVSELRKKAQERNSTLAFFEEKCVAEDEQQPFVRVISMMYQLYKKFGKLDKKNYVGKPPGMLAQDFVEFTLASLPEEELINIYNQVESDLGNIFSSAVCFLRSHAKAHPICLVWEDIHHVDKETAEFLVYLRDHAENDHLLNIILYHGEERSGENCFQRLANRFRKDDKVIDIKLFPLLARETIPFIRGLVGVLQVDRSEIMPLYKVTRGNPYQLIDFVKSLAEQKKIYWEDGAWQVEISKDILTRPPKGVEEMLISDLPKLGAHHKTLLEYMSTAATPLSGDFLTALTGLKNMQIALVMKDLTKEKYVIQDDENSLYSISSNGIEAEAAKLLNEKQLKKMHLHITKTMEKKCECKGEELLRLADHSYAGEDFRKGFQYSFDAGRWLASENRLRLALKYYRQALKIGKNTKKKGLFEVVVEIGFLLSRMGNHKDALDYFNEADSLAAKPEETFQVRKGKGICYYGMRKNSQALKEFQNALRMPQKTQDVELLLYQSSLELYRFQLKKARGHLNEAKNVSTNDKILIPVQNKLSGLINFYTGDWKTAKEELLNSEEVFAELQNNQDTIEILLGKAYLISHQQNLDEAKEIMQKIFPLLEDTDDWLLQFQANYQAGLFACDQKQFGEARKYFEKVEEIAKKTSGREKGYAIHGIALCEFHGKVDFEKIEKLAKELLEIADTYKDGNLAAEAYLIMGRMYMLSKQYGDAERYFDYSRDGFRSLDCAWKENRLATLHARVYTLLKQPKKALGLLVESEKKAIEREDSAHIADNYFERGFLLGFNRKFSEAAQWFQKAGDLYGQMGKRKSAHDAKVNENNCRQAASKGS